MSSTVVATGMRLLGRKAGVASRQSTVKRSKVAQSKGGTNGTKPSHSPVGQVRW